MLKYFQKKGPNQERDKGKSRERQDAESPAGKTKENTRPTADAASPVRKDPILDDEDQAFLERIVTEEGPAPPLPARPHPAAAAPGDAQTILMQGADKTPLPDVPDTPEHEVANAIEGEAVQLALRDKDSAEEEKEKERKKKNRFSWLRRSSSRSTRRADRTATGSSLHDAAQGLKAPGGDKEDGTTAAAKTSTEKSEQEEMADVLEQLNLAAENNRVFSMSEESKELLKQFNLVLRDLVNGVPTAYRDLESLLTNSDQQIQKTYKSLPPFLQELIEKLPEKFTANVLGPAGLAAAAEEASGEHGGGDDDDDKTESKKKAKGKAEYLATGAATAGKLLKVKIPSLKELLARQGSVVALLRSVVAALRTRFPALMGVGAVWSVALFVLLFIFWYCHKRGREVRLERERKVTEHEVEEIRRRVAADPAWTPPPGWDDGSLTTRAPLGSSLDEIAAASYPEPEIEEPPSDDEEKKMDEGGAKTRSAKAVGSKDV